MTSLIETLRHLHDGIFGSLERITQGWFFGLFARFAFAAMLYVYYWNSAKTKIGEGVLGVFQVSDGAYIQIVGKAFEAAGYDSSALPLQAHLMVYAGTYGEFILPVLIVLGLFSRIGSLGMIFFILVQTYVDATGHGVELGALFNGQPNEIIDQRIFWCVPLVYVVLKGPGLISLDTVLFRWWTSRTPGTVTA